MKIQQYQKVWVLIGIALFILAINNDSTKKEVFPAAVLGGASWLTGSTLPVIGTGVGAATAVAWPWFGIPLIILSGLMFMPNIIQNWGNLFNPQPTIPIWVWLGAGLILLVIVMKKK